MFPLVNIIHYISLLIVCSRSKILIYLHLRIMRIISCYPWCNKVNVPSIRKLTNWLVNLVTWVLYDRNISLKRDKVNTFIFQYKYPVGIYWSEVKNVNTWTMCITFIITIQTPERRQWHSFGLFFINFEQISKIILKFPSLTWTSKQQLINNIFPWKIK